MVRRLAEASPAAGVEAHVYCLSEGRLAEFLRAGGVPLRVFDSGGRFDLKFVRSMAAAAREDGLQVLQAHTSRTHLIARLLSRWLGIPNITTIQSPIALDENRGTARHPWRARVERLGRRWTDAICPVSREETERLAREEGVARAKLHWIPNGIEPVAESTLEPAVQRVELARTLREHRLPEDAFVVAMVAQMRPRKGPEVLLEAFGRYRADGGQGVLLMIGDDEFAGKGFLERLRLMAASFGFADRALFTGFMIDPWRLAGGADLLVLPSMFGEGLPLVLLEAMNRALPLAVSNIQGNRELVEGSVTGWLHTPGDAGMLSRQLSQAARDREATRRRGRAGRELFLSRYTLATVVAQYRKLYDELAGGAD